MTPKYVLHDERRWLVKTGDTMLDGVPAYELSPANGQGVGIIAYQTDCIPDDRPRKRRLRDDGYVLEFDSRGTITIREHGRRKRFTTSLAAIYAMTVRAATLNRKAPKRVKRGLLSRR